ncbi:MAG: acylphosphatase [Betaproteobacteria bacterium]|nr:MAG: acylphosphatase [Betaproteobacteria bacterium]
MIARRLTISGEVQGVGFRYALADEARARNLRGWVRNRRDGSVEAIVAGTEADVEAVIAWARHGPPAARVTRVAVEPAATDSAEFEIVSSA